MIQQDPSLCTIPSHKESSKARLKQLQVVLAQKIQAENATNCNLAPGQT